MLKLFTVAALFMGLTMASESSTGEITNGESGSTTSSPSTTTVTTTVAVQNRDDVTCNYYYGPFDTSYFAYAVNQCTQYSILQGEFMYATCLNSTHIKVNIYLTSFCNGTAYSSKVYDSSQATFYCGGVDAYAKIKIGVTSCPASYYVYSAINTCTNASSTIWSSVYCSGSNGEIQYYTSDTCSDATFSSLDQMTATCGYLFTTIRSKTKIYGQIESCFTGATTTTPPTSSIGHMYNINNVIAFFFVVFLLVTLQL